MEKHQCSKCKRLLSLASFHRGKRGVYYQQCKSCQNKRIRRFSVAPKSGVTCHDCNTPLPGGIGVYCRECPLKRGKKYRISQKEKYRKQAVDYRRRLKEDAYEHYGSECACCGEKEIAFLSIDHINGGGLRHLKEIGAKSGTSILEWLKKK